MKRHGNLFEKIASFDKLPAAERAAYRGKRPRKNNLINLRHVILSAAKDLGCARVRFFAALRMTRSENAQVVLSRAKRRSPAPAAFLRRLLGRTDFRRVLPAHS